MLVCDTCGCLVEEEMLERHKDWHADLLMLSSLPKYEGPVANPGRHKVDENGFSYQDC